MCEYAWQPRYLYPFNVFRIRSYRSDDIQDCNSSWQGVLSPMLHHFHNIKVQFDFALTVIIINLETIGRTIQPSGDESLRLRRLLTVKYMIL